MALTESKPMVHGEIAPPFNLIDTVSGKRISLEDLHSDTATVIIFMCNHCPYVVHIIDKLAEVARHYTDKGIQFFGISSNDINNYPADGPDRMTDFAKRYKLVFPYLYDESQDVAKAYDAACTPEFYVFNAGLACIYHGRFDASTPGNGKSVTGDELSAALDAALVGAIIPEEQQFPAIGCGIKWQ